MQKTRIVKCQICDGSGLSKNGNKCGTCSGEGCVNITGMPTIFSAISPTRNAGISSCWEPEGSTDVEPTDAPAGSVAKVAEMRRRLEAGQEIFHAADNPTAVSPDLRGQ